MCGIVYAESFNEEPVNDFIFDTFYEQRHRGIKGFGIYDGQELNMVKATKEEKIVDWLCKYNSTRILFHHRYPTSTKNVKRASHPFSTKDFFGKDVEYILVHNGVISNADKMFDDHYDNHKIEYSTLLDTGDFNDSETLLWDFALYMEGKQKELKATGTIAFICLKKEKGVLTKMYFGRNNGNPLNMFRTGEGLSLSSEGIGDPIDENTLYTYNYQLKRLTTKKLEIKRWSTTTSTSNNYGNYQPSSHKWNQKDEKWESNYDPHYSDSRYVDIDDGDSDDPMLIADYMARGYRPTEYKRSAPEYEHDPKTQKLVPVNIEPDIGAVEVKAMEYITEAMGNFETAYWLAEYEYEDLQELYDTYEPSTDQFSLDELIADLQLIEAVLAFIDNDSEFVDSTSVSSMYSALYEMDSEEQEARRARKAMKQIKLLKDGILDKVEERSSL